MALTRASLRAAFDRNRTTYETVAVSIAATIAFGLLGLRVHRIGAPLRSQLEQLRSASQAIATFKHSYQPATQEEQVRWSASPEVLALGISHTRRLSLAQSITARAETLGLRDVRVRFVTSDSAVIVPPRQAATGASINVAPYTMTVEFAGGFADALTLVRDLPATVALTNIRVAHTKNGAQYFLTLAVYETVDDNRPA